MLCPLISFSCRPLPTYLLIFREGPLIYILLSDTMNTGAQVALQTGGNGACNRDEIEPTSISLITHPPRAKRLQNGWTCFSLTSQHFAILIFNGVNTPTAIFGVIFVSIYFFAKSIVHCVFIIIIIFK